MYWNRDPRRRKGGYWRCTEARRVNDERHGPGQAARKRQRYDADPVYRLTKNISRNARRRALTLQRHRDRLELMRGPLSP